MKFRYSADKVCPSAYKTGRNHLQQTCIVMSIWEENQFQKKMTQWMLI
jgi:hypothetical protein